LAVLMPPQNPPAWFDDNQGGRRQLIFWSCVQLSVSMPADMPSGRFSDALNGVDCSSSLAARSV